MGANRETLPPHLREAVEKQLASKPSRQPHVVVLHMPYPPSVNHYWRSFSGRNILSEEGREYRKAAAACIFTSGISKVRGRVSVLIRATMPDRRRRDLDNILKPLLDALTHGGVIDDDSCIDDLRITRGRVDRECAGVLVAIQEQQP